MHYLFILKQSPYQSSLAREALDLALASAAFDQKVSLLFIDDGVYQLKSKQQSQTNIKQKNIEKTLGSLPLFDVTDVHVCQQSLSSRGLSVEDLIKDIDALPADQVPSLVAAADKVLSF